MGSKQSKRDPIVNDKKRLLQEMHIGMDIDDLRCYDFHLDVVYVDKEYIKYKYILTNTSTRVKYILLTFNRVRFKDSSIEAEKLVGAHYMTTNTFCGKQLDWGPAITIANKMMNDRTIIGQSFEELPLKYKKIYKEIFIKELTPSGWIITQRKYITRFKGYTPNLLFDDKHKIKALFIFI